VIELRVKNRVLTDECIRDFHDPLSAAIKASESGNRVLSWDKALTSNGAPASDPRHDNW